MVHSSKVGDLPKLSLSSMSKDKDTDEEVQDVLGKPFQQPQVVRMTRSASCANARSLSCSVRRQLPDRQSHLSSSRASLHRRSTNDLHLSKLKTCRSSASFFTGQPALRERRASRAETIEDLYDQDNVDWNAPELNASSDEDADAGSTSMSMSMSSFQVSGDPRLRRKDRKSQQLSKIKIKPAAQEKIKIRNTRKWSEGGGSCGNKEKVCGLLSKLNDSFDIDDTSSEDAGSIDDDDGYSAIDSCRSPAPMDGYSTPPESIMNRSMLNVARDYRELSPDVNTWSVEDVAHWASQSHHLGYEVEQFMFGHHISGPVLLRLDEDLLLKLGMDKFGLRMQLMISIQKLQQSGYGQDTILEHKAASSTGEDVFERIDSSRIDSSRVGRSDVSTVDSRPRKMERIQSTPVIQRSELKASTTPTCMMQDGDDSVRFYPATPQVDRAQGPRPVMTFSSNAGSPRVQVNNATSLTFPTNGLHSANVSPRTYQIQSPTQSNPATQRRSPRMVVGNPGFQSARSTISNFTSVSSRVNPPAEQPVQQTSYRTTPRLQAAPTVIMTPGVPPPQAQIQQQPQMMTTQVVPTTVVTTQNYRQSPRVGYNPHATKVEKCSPRYNMMSPPVPPPSRSVRRASTLTGDDLAMRASYDGTVPVDFNENVRSLTQQVARMADQMQSMSQLPKMGQMDDRQPSYRRTVSGGPLGSMGPPMGPPASMRASQAGLKTISQGRSNVTNAQQVPSQFSRVSNTSPQRFSRPGAQSPFSFQRHNSVIQLGNSSLGNGQAVGSMNSRLPSVAFQGVSQPQFFSAAVAEITPRG